MATIDAGVCERIVTAATAHCAAPAQIVQSPPATQIIKEPNWEGVTTGLTALSADFALALVILGIITILIGLGWGTFVLMWAERAAKKEAKDAAHKWLNENGAGLVREHLDLLSAVTQPPPGGGQGGEDAAGQIAEQA